MESNKGSLRCKIVVVGDTQCGKTALLHVFAKDSYPEVRRHCFCLEKSRNIIASLETPQICKNDRLVCVFKCCAYFLRPIHRHFYTFKRIHFRLPTSCALSARVAHRASLPCRCAIFSAPSTCFSEPVLRQSS